MNITTPYILILAVGAFAVWWGLTQIGLIPSITPKPATQSNPGA